MHLDFIDLLRCPAEHPETYLVAAPAELDDRSIVRGTLGCPKCSREYAIEDGVVFLSQQDPRAAASTLVANEYEALRCAALLDLQGGPGLAVLEGEFGVLAPSIVDSLDVHLLLFNPPRTVRHGVRYSIVVADQHFPFATQRARGVALYSSSSESTVATAASLVRNGGRLVAPVQATLPANARLLAADDRHQVAEVSHAALATISIARRKS